MELGNCVVDVTRALMASTFDDSQLYTSAALASVTRIQQLTEDVYTGEDFDPLVAINQNEVGEAFVCASDSAVVDTDCAVTVLTTPNVVCCC